MRIKKDNANVMMIMKPTLFTNGAKKNFSEDSKETKTI